MHSLFTIGDCPVKVNIKSTALVAAREGVGEIVEKRRLYSTAIRG
jgi:hypothetical protein